ncbi:hypothetical protein [Lacticaseibacillus jixiensis]|uniref:hypothetical protein n=1 Tax=Lacticaseibacillus jixiensis TaxID=3231926 RepID=UPI0036F19BEC
MLFIGIRTSTNIRHLDAGPIRYYIRLPGQYYGIGDHNKVQINVDTKTEKGEIIAMFVDDLAINHDLIFFHDTGMDLATHKGLTDYYAALNTKSTEIQVFKTKASLYRHYPTASTTVWKRPVSFEWYGYEWQVN